MLTETEINFILDTLSGKIPEEEFFIKRGTDRKNVSHTTLKLLQEGLETKDSDTVQLGLMLGHRFGFTPEFLPTLNQLADEPWHTSHENAVSALAVLKDPSSVPVLERTAVVLHPYKSWDKAFALNTKSVYALRNIGTPEAVRALGKLTQHKNRIIRSPAKELLRGLAKTSASDEVRVLAKSFLKKPSQ